MYNDVHNFSVRNKKLENSNVIHIKFGKMLPNTTLFGTVFPSNVHGCEDLTWPCLLSCTDVKLPRRRAGRRRLLLTECAKEKRDLSKRREWTKLHKFNSFCCTPRSVGVITRRTDGKGIQHIWKGWDRYKCCIRFEVFTAVTMKNGVFWDVTPCGSCNNRRFGGT
jgi:hypothetical protein